MKNHKSNLLIDAVFTGKLVKVVRYLESGMDVNSQDSDKRSPLMHAVIDKQNEIVKLLLGRGADVNAKDFNEWTALHFAAQNNDYEIVSLLISRGAKVNAQDSNGNTPLWRAEFESRDTTLIQDYLIQKGADDNLKNFHDVSPKDLRGL